MTNKHISPRLLSSALCGSMLLSTAAQADGTLSDDWQYKAAIYLWGASIGGDTTVQSDAQDAISQADLGISFDNLLDNLDMAFMGSFEARKGKWSIITDLLYLDISAGNRNKIGLPTEPPIRLNTRTKLDLSGWVLQAAGGYNLISDERSSFDVLVGARYFELDTGFSADLSLLNREREYKASASGSVLDAFIGMKGSYALAPNWTVLYYADLGAGQSDFTWQANGGISYKATKHVDVALTYRHLEWDIGGDGLDNMNFSGPLLGVIFNW